MFLKTKYVLKNSPESKNDVMVHCTIQTGTKRISDCFKATTSCLKTKKAFTFLAFLDQKQTIHNSKIIMKNQRAHKIEKRREHCLELKRLLQVCCARV